MSGIVAPVTVSIASQLIYVYYLSLASFAILYYDYALTLQEEIERFWRNKRLTWASFLFYANRYLSVLGHIPVMYQYFWNNGSRTLQKFAKSLHPLLLSVHQYLAIVIQVIVGVILITRTYALYDRSKWALIIMLAAAVAVIGFGIWSVASGMDVDPVSTLISPVGCLLPLSAGDGIRLASAWTGMLFFDILIIVMTIYKSLKYYRNGPIQLLHVLLRDGLVYFVVMAAVGLGNILTFHVRLKAVYISPAHSPAEIVLLALRKRLPHDVCKHVSLGAALLQPKLNPILIRISSTMASRLMLNLRDPKLATPKNSRRTTTERPSEPMLSTVVAGGTEYTETLNDIDILSHSTTQDIELMPRTRTHLQWSA
ncbi:hypothetical protein BD779DRAFT_1677645 [Infundibulicybe gibba]|nr:hypothetical protein BD779DRAFT_1677645 [Infundibulicybe gibba]